MYQSYNDAREERIRIFEDTARLCREHPALKKSIEASRKGQLLIPEGNPIQTNTQRQGTPARIIVSKRRSLEAAVSYRGKKVAVHNFASATNPGGGVTKLRSSYPYYTKLWRENQ